MRHGEAGDATVSQGATLVAPEPLGVDGIVAIVILLVAAPDPSGYCYYRRYPFMVERTPMLPWGQATTHRALAYLSLRQRVDG